jgi:uncharacterized protein
MNARNGDSPIDFIEFPAKSPQEIEMIKRFYGSVFGWHFREWGDDYVDTSDSGVNTGFNADPAHRSKSPLVVIQSPHLEEARRRVLDAGGVITKEIFAFPGGRRFHYRDPAGNELAIWSHV